MPPSTYQSKQFTISYHNPISEGGNWAGDLTISVQGWRHSIAAFGGFDSAEFTLVENDVVMQDWLLNGLGRPIVLRDETLLPVWEGFVNTITVHRSGLSVTYGPLSDIGNRVSAVYSVIDTSQDPPETGDRKKTAIVNNTNSQSMWGIWPTILSLSGVTDSNASQLVNMYAQEHAYPEINSKFSFGSGGISIDIGCIGWVYTLRHPYNNTVDSFTIDLSQRIQQIVTAQLNPWISTNYSRIVSNTTPVKAYQNEDQLALEQIKGLTAMGDSSNNRHLFGVYENRQAVYEKASTQIDYILKLQDKNQLILDPSGAVVPPWRIRPGKWAFFSDYMPGLGSPFPNLHEDPRVLQIEFVDFDMRAPFAVQFSGGHYSKYEQKLARLGLRGMDV